MKRLQTSKSSDEASQYVLTSAQVSRALGLSLSTLRRRARTGAIPARKYAGRWRFDRSTILKPPQGSNSRPTNVSESNLDLASVLGSLPVGVTVVDADGVILASNDRAGRIFGWSSHALFGTNLEALIPTHRNRKHRYTSSLLRLLDDPDWKPHGVRSDGSRVSLDLDVEHLSDGDSWIVVIHETEGRSRTENMLAQAVKDLAKAQEVARLGSWTFDLQTKEVRWSDEMYRIVGLDPAEGQAMSFEAFLDRIHSDDRETIRKKHGALIRRGKPFTSEYRTVPINGRSRIVRMHADVTYDDAGTPVLMTGVDQDVTEEKAREREIQDAQLRYRTMIESLSEGVVLENRDFEIIASNAAAERILGLEHDQLLGLTSMDPRWATIHLDGSEFPGETHPGAVTLKTGEPQRNVIMGVHRLDGSLRWVSINTEPLSYGDSEVVDIVLISFADVTDYVLTRRRLENQLRWMKLHNDISRAIARRTDAESICRVTLASLHSTLGFAFGAVFLRKEEDDHLSISSVHPAEHTVAQAINDCSGSPLSVRSSFIDSVAQNKTHVIPVGKGSNDETPFRSEFMNCLASNSVVMLAVMPIEIRDIGGALVCLAFTDRHELDEFAVGLLDDVASDIGVALHSEYLNSRLRNSYDDLKKTQEALLEKERLNAMGQMASGIAHDINNTLAPITLYTEALLQGDEMLSPRAQKFIEMIQNASADIAGTIGRLRTFYRKPQQEERIRSVISLREFVTEIIEITKPRWHDLPQRNGTTIDVRCDIAEPMKLVAIESEVREAIINLVFNAVDALPNGGTVTVQAREQNDEIVIEVEDDGVGMNDEQRQRCLEPFYSTKGKLGTGLGLPTVFGVMRRHHGGVEIESAGDKGTVVRLVFPSSPEPASYASRTASPAVPPLRILCIDDEPAVRESMRDTLEIDGHTVISAVNGEDGVQAVQKALGAGEPFDVVITDLGMPHIDGWEVADRVKKLAPGTPVLILSGWGNLMDNEDINDRNVNAILGKPPRINDLRAALAEVASALESNR